MQRQPSVALAFADVSGSRGAGAPGWASGERNRAVKHWGVLFRVICLAGQPRRARSSTFGKDPVPFLPSTVSREELLPHRGLVGGRCASSLGAVQADGLRAVWSGRPCVGTLPELVMASALCPSQNYGLCEDAKRSPLWQPTCRARLGHGPGAGLCGEMGHRCRSVADGGVPSSPGCPRGVRRVRLSISPSPQSVPSALGTPGVAAF